jgi:hypothetical protein
MSASRFRLPPSQKPRRSRNAFTDRSVRLAAAGAELVPDDQRANDEQQRQDAEADDREQSEHPAQDAGTSPGMSLPMGKAVRQRTTR